MSFYDYTTLLVCAAVASFMAWRYRKTAMIPRILDGLIKAQEAEEKEEKSNNSAQGNSKESKSKRKMKKSREKGFDKSAYCLRNPYIKLSSGFFDIEDDVVPTDAEVLDKILETGEGILG